MDDSTIIKRCQAGQLDLFELLVHRYKTPVYSFCLKLAKNEPDAADLFQDTWLKALKNIEKCRPDSRILSWFFSICINSYRDNCRKRKRWRKRIIHIREDSGFEGSSELPGPDSVLAHKDQNHKLRLAVQSLPDKFRMPVLLFYFGEFQLKEIGTMLEIPEGTVKSRLTEAKKRLKRRMTEEKHG
ncbi:MAG: sigma-70 family RNA polymerase sigma factor [Acidobacteria bacterium]|nr:sigma-70 family RNA polymerase sigma factor [Acidobacteriota bacterium]